MASSREESGILADRDETTSKSSSSDEEFERVSMVKKHSTPLISCLGVCGVGLLLVGLIALLRHKEPTNSACRGYMQCPPYPEPYAFGEWPTSYETSSGTFPEDFMWGVGTAAYQVEGGYRDGGRGASIWDTYTGANTINMPGGNCSYCCKVAPCLLNINPAMKAKGATGNVACNHYNMWEQDIQLMKSMGLKNYRFSISWSRVIPTGRVSDGVSEKGIEFYNGLISGLIAAGIQPAVTLYHWDLPQGLLDPPRNKGWWSKDATTGEPDGQIIPDFVAYADLCFKSFGDRVKMWITFNEAWTFLYLDGAPNIKDYDHTTVFTSVHNVLNAHAAAVDLYNRKYRSSQKGMIGITNNLDWHEPNSTKDVDIAAADRLNLFQLGWFSEPIYGPDGDYPPEMRRVLGDKLPKFTPEQSQLLRNSADFFGLNHYGTGFASNNPAEAGWLDAYANQYHRPDQVRGQSEWLFSGPWGLRKLLNWVKRRYGNWPIYVTENGWSVAANKPSEGIDDMQRLGYYANYTSEVRKAIVEDGVDVKGYFGWSFMDNFEWTQGYAERFGVNYNDYAFGFDPNSPTNQVHQPTTKGQKRYRKKSSCWLQAVWFKNSLVGLEDTNYKECVARAISNLTS